MENTNEKDAMQPFNDGENQGHDWMRHAPENDQRNMAPDREESLEKEEEEQEESADWGDLDPQHDPLQPPGPMDPSGPGSAV